MSLWIEGATGNSKYFQAAGSCYIASANEETVKGASLGNCAWSCREKGRNIQLTEARKPSIECGSQPYLNILSRDLSLVLGVVTKRERYRYHTFIAFFSHIYPYTVGWIEELIL